MTRSYNPWKSRQETSEEDQKYALTLYLKRRWNPLTEEDTRETDPEEYFYPQPRQPRPKTKLSEN